MANATLIQMVTVFLMVFLISMERVNSQGHMSIPPMRSSMWRYGFPTPENYDDNQLWCGSEKTQHDDVNQGRCGECGDTWSDSRPRDNDEGGKYGTGIIAANYTQAQQIDVQVILTVNHGGFFEFRLCADKKSANELTTNECFDKNLLQLEDGSTRYILGLNEGMPTTVNLTVRLPVGVSCQYCVLQMWWKTNINNNGCNSTDIGCGEQEEYKNCADIVIAPNEDWTTETLSMSTQESIETASSISSDPTIQESTVTTTTKSTVSISATPSNTNPSYSEVSTSTVEPEMPTIPIDSPSNTTETSSTSTRAISSTKTKTTTSVFSTTYSSTAEESTAITKTTSTELPITARPKSPNTALYIVAGVLGLILLFIVILGLIYIFINAKKNRRRDSQIPILPIAENTSTSQSEKIYGLLRTNLYGY